MEKKKKIIEEALNDIKAIHEILGDNTKEILRSVMKEEIENIVKDELSDSDYDEEDVEDNVDTKDKESELEDDVEKIKSNTKNDNEFEEDELDNENNDDEVIDLRNASDEEIIKIFKKMDNEDGVVIMSRNEIDYTDEDTGKEYKIIINDKEIDNLNEEDKFDFDDLITDTENYLKDNNDENNEEEDDEIIYEIEMEKDEEELEKDNNENEKLLELINNMDEDDVLEVVSENKITLEDIKKWITSKDKLNEEEVIDLRKMPKDQAIKMLDKIGEDDEVELVNENRLNEKEDEEEVIDLTKMPKDQAIKMINKIRKDDEVELVNEDENEEIEDDEEYLDEAIPKGTAQARRMPGRNTKIKGPGAKTFSKWSPELNERKEYNKLLVETNKLRKENNKFKNILKEFKKTLHETVIYNTNLTYITKLFTEYSTTKNEKLDIVKRFDNEAKTLSESKTLYNKIKSELEYKNKNNLKTKLNENVKGRSLGNLKENRAYVDPQTQKILNLMNQIDKM